MKCLSLRLCKSYRFKEDNEPGSFEKFKSIDDLNIISDSTATRNANQNQRRYAVIWEPVQNSTKAIPVFVKSSKDKDQIKYAFERDEFLNKVIVGKRLQKVIDAMYIREVKMKEKIILEGDPGKHMYIISEGKFEVSKEAKGVVATLQAGRVFGELAILYKSRRQATVKALTPGKVWVLDREVYQTIVKQYNIEEKSERVVFLEECPILNKVDRDILEKVADLLHVEYFPTGKVIVREGAPADKFYIITAGSVTIMKESEGFKGYLYKGNCFGERAILSEGVRQATVLAGNSGVECLTLDRQHFINHFGNVEDIAKISIPKLPKVVLKPQEVDKNQNLKSADFRILCTIGEGGFGRVEMIQKKNDPSITFALKCLNRIDMVKNKQSQHILNEKEIQMACESPFIVKLYKTEKDKKYLYFWLEICLGGEIYTWLQNHRNKRFDERTAKFVAGCLLEALSYLHERGVVYRDIKPENLLVDQRGYVKLADFGFAKKLDPFEKTSTFAGTPEYVAPEIIASLEYDKAVDFWSYGILIFELLNGSSPFADEDYTQIYRNIERGFHRVSIPSHFSENATKLIQSLLRHLPEERLGYRLGGPDKIRTHPWYTDFDWRELKKCTMDSPLKPVLKNNIDLSYLNIIKKRHIIPKEDTSHVFDDF